jgi:hypothetical protein
MNEQKSRGLKTSVISESELETLYFTIESITSLPFIPAELDSSLKDSDIATLFLVKSIGLDHLGLRLATVQEIYFGDLGLYRLGEAKTQLIPWQPPVDPEHHRGNQTLN